MAVLQKQTAVVTLKGLNQKSPGTIAAPGELELAENLIAKRGSGQGGFEFVRRNGMTVIANNIYATPGSRLASYQDSLIALTTPYQFGDGSNTAGKFLAYDPDNARALTLGVAGFSASLAPMRISRSGIANPTNPAVSGAVTPTSSSLDLAYVGNVALYTWIDETSTINYSLRTTKGVSLRTGQLEVGTNVKCVALGTAFYVFWKNVAGDIRGASFAATGYSPGTLTTVIAAASTLAGTDYDVQTGFNATNIALMYRASAANHVRCLLSTTFVVGTSITDATVANQPTAAMCWFPQSAFAGTLYYATVNTVNGAKVQSINSTTLAITATTSEPTVTAAANITGYVYFGVPVLVYEITNAVSHRHSVFCVPAVVGNGISGFGLASRCFYVNGVPHTWGLYNSSAGAIAPQDSYGLIGLNYDGDMKIVGKAATGIAGRQATLHLSSVGTDSDGVQHFLGQQANFVDSATGAALTLQYALSDIGVSNAEPYERGAPIAAGGVLLIPGSQVSEYDGSLMQGGYSYANVREAGFFHYPEPPTLAEGAAASGSMAPATYSYVAVYKWTDRSGQVTRSSPSTPVAITTVNVNSSVTVTTDKYRALSRFQCQLELYRTPGNGDGSEYFRVTPAVLIAPAGGIGTQAFTDVASDATLAAGEPYVPSAAGGELENAAWPVMHVLCEHKNRVFGVMSEEPHRIAFSKEYVPGTGLGFFDGFVISTPQNTGPIYALASMDGHLIAIKRDTIYVIDGDFPDANGGGPPIPMPTVIPAGVGTTDPRSVVVAGIGVMFHSRTKGFWLLSRSLQVSYIGAQVEATANTGGVVISGASVMSDQTQVRWTSEGGTSFVLDTYFLELGTPIWTTFTGQPCAHSINHLGRWYHLDKTGAGSALGRLKVENAIWCDGTQLGETGSFTPGTEYFAKLTVADINFGGILGFVRCWRGHLLGEWFAAHNVKVTLTRNHRSIAENPFTFNATADPDPYMMEFRPRVQKATSLAVTVEETTTGSQQTQGAAWTALAFSVGIKPGVSRLPQTKTMVGS